MTRVTLTFRPEEEIEIPTRTELEDLRRQGVIHSFVDPDPREAEKVPEEVVVDDLSTTTGEPGPAGPSIVDHEPEKSGKAEKKKGGDPE